MKQVKTFTLEESNNALVLVAPIVQDILLKRKKMQELKEIQKYSVDPSIRKDLRSIAYEIIYHLQELEKIGCFLKDLKMGVVDFPAYFDGDFAVFSWHPGQVAVNSSGLLSV